MQRKLVVLIFLLSALGCDLALARSCNTDPNPLTISSDCYEYITSASSKSAVTVDKGVSVTNYSSGSTFAAFLRNSVVGTFTNNGTIGATYPSRTPDTAGFILDGGSSITSFINNGTISNSNGAGYQYGMWLGGKIGSLINWGTISSDGISGYALLLDSSGSISTLSNWGTIAGYGTSVDLKGSMTTLNNYGTISSEGGVGISAETGSKLTTLTNYGTIQGNIVGSSIQHAVWVGSGASIGTINNLGTMEHVGCNGISGCGAGIFNAGSIGIINNVGDLTNGVRVGYFSDSSYGIINYGSMGTLSNGQNNLTYQGALPTNYNAILFSPSDYGKVTFTNPTGVTNFGVYSNSATIPSGTTSFTAVVSGLSASNFAATKGTSPGDNFANISWTLTNPGNGSVWDLATTNNINTNPVVVGSSAGSSLAGAIGGTYQVVAPVTTTGPTTITTTTTPTTPTPTPTSTTVYTSVTTVIPTSTSQSTTTTTTTYTVTTGGNGTTTTSPTVTTTASPTVKPAPVATTSTTATTSQTNTNAGATTATTTTTSTQTITQAPNSPTLKNGSSFVDATQQLSTGQVNQLASVHAEGYGSNMTIGLQQMGQVSLAVMDRIHTPMSNQKGGASSAYEIDQGRYVWVDGTGSTGNVNSYWGLSGFDFTVYDLLLGADLYRDSSGALGVFVGGGATNMTESAQVNQRFNTSNAFAGIYGGKYLPWNMKLSGSLGYVYGNNNATRNNIDIGQFTGGTAVSNYNTNGLYAAIKLAKPILTNEFVTLTPFVGVSYSQLWMGQANERGGADFNYTLSAATAYTTMTFLGGEALVPLTEDVKMPLALLGFYKFSYDWFANSGRAHTVVANSSVFGSFSQIGANMGPVQNLMGVGFQGSFMPGTSVRVGSVGSLNSNGWQAGGGGEFRWEF